MAQNVITDLQLIDLLQDTANFAVDDGIQTYRATANQIKDFVLPNQGLTLEKLSEALIQILCPTGKVGVWPVATGAPNGWLMCNGQAVSRSTYAKLFEKIGITHGQGNGSTTFNVPDYRGVFLRGVSDGTTNDPDRASRTAMNTGGNTGDNVGSIQGDATKRPNSNFTTNSQGAHTHDFESDSSTVSPVYNSGSGTIVGTNNALGRRSAAGGKYTVSGAVQSNGNHSHSITGGGDNETRPKNAYVYFIIKT